MTVDYQELAKQCAGNWRKFQSFAWHTQYDLEDPDDHFIWYFETRDSRLLEQSNAAAIQKKFSRLLKTSPYVWYESHSHWGPGWIGGFIIKVHDKQGRLSTPFKRYCEIQQAFEDYPALDDEDYSYRVWEATWNNIEAEVERRLWALGIDNAPDDIVDRAFEYINNNHPNDLENVDDEGGYPSEQIVEEAILAVLPQTPIAV